MQQPLYNKLSATQIQIATNKNINLIYTTV